MTKRHKWQDDNWLLVMQLYLQRPVGVKPMYSRAVVALSLELHIPPPAIHAKLVEVASLQTPRVERIWREYGQNPRRLSRAVRLLRQMSGFNTGGEFYEGVALQESFEADFRPLEEDARLTPVALTLILDLYFRLTPITMVGDTPEVQELARLLKVPAALVVDVLHVYQHCDPYLDRSDVMLSPLLLPCSQVWQRYGNGDTEQLAAHASRLSAYYE